MAADSGGPGTEVVEPSSGPSTKQTVVQVAALLAVLAAFALAPLIIQAVINAAGWVTPVSNLNRVIIGTTAAAITAITARKALLAGGIGNWALVTIVVLVAGGVMAAWFLRGETSLFSGQLTESEPEFEHVLSADTGDRIVIVLETADGLVADLSLLRGRTTYDSIADSSGRNLIDQTLHGGQWIVRARAVDSTVGTYDLRIERQPGRPISLGSEIEGSLTDNRDSDGFRFTLEQSQLVYVGVQPQDDLDLEVALRLSGWAVANPAFKTGLWEIYRRLQPGEYMVLVRSPSGQLGDYSLSLLADAPPGTPTDTTLPSSVEVAVPPDLVGSPRTDAEASLGELGFAFASWDVCSSSVEEGVVRQIVREDPELGEIVIQDLDGMIGSESVQPADTNLVLKVSTGQPCSAE